MRATLQTRVLSKPYLSLRLNPVGRNRSFPMATNATKAKTALDEMKGGAFVRTDALFRNKIEKGGRFEPEAGRYHLYISLACPWANRCLAVRNLKGLQDVIGLSIVHPTWQRTRPNDPADTHVGWVFAAPTDPPLQSTGGFGSFSCEDCIPDDVNHARFVRDLYEMAGDQSGKYSVPVLWDKKEKTIVNNESSEIIRMLNDQFNHLATNPSLDLYPEDMRAAIDEVNSWAYPNINNGVYRCGFAKTQEAYETAFAELFAALDKCESILATSPFIAGQKFSEADVRLYMTLIRFDEVYVVYFKTNKKRIQDYPHLNNYVRRIYHMPGMKEVTNMRHIKTHYFTSHQTLNHYAIVPAGGEVWWEQPPSS